MLKFQIKPLKTVWRKPFFGLLAVLEGCSALRSSHQRAGKGIRTALGRLRRTAVPLPSPPPPPPFIKKKREWTKADGIFTFMSFKKS